MNLDRYKGDLRPNTHLKDLSSFFERIMRFLCNSPRSSRLSKFRKLLSSILLFPLVFVLFGFFLSLFDIRIISPDSSWIILDRKYQFLAEVQSPQGMIGYWPMPDTIPANIRNVVLAAEDRRFSSHWGVDLKSVGRAVINNYLRRNGFSGASTIAMQTARLQRGGRSSVFNKVRDSFCAVWLTLFYGKERVLQQYLTIAPFGNRINGISCAARRYFKKPIQDLSLAEAALLVSVPRAPGRMNLFTHNGFAKAGTRAAFVLKRCYEYGWISETEFRQSIGELNTFTVPSKDIRDEAAMHAVLTYESLLQNSTTFKDKGLVLSSIDLEIQSEVQEALREQLMKLYSKDVENGAVIVLDLETHEVLAYVGSSGYFAPYSGSIDHGNLPRSTGSLLKSFIYAYGMEELGYTAATVLTDVNHDFGAGTSSFVPENSDKKYLGPVLYKYALANSRNIPSVQVLNELGVSYVYQRFSDLGLVEDDGRGEYYGLGLSIGGLFCSLRNLCRAYLCFSDSGRVSDLVWFKDQTIRGDVQAISPDIAAIVQRYLADPLARMPTFPRGGNLEYPFAVAVKTGTSDGYRDSWCIAWSRKYLVGAWMGNADNHPTKKVSGYDGSAPLVKRILLGLHPEEKSGLEDKGFSPPGGWIPVSVCRLTGKLADRSTPYSATEYFKPGTEPQEYSIVSRALPIDKRNGLLATASCPDHIEYRTCLVLDPEFEDWAQVQGMPLAPSRVSPLCGGQSIIEEYVLQITWPRSGARFFIDPEMPSDLNILTVSCTVSPQSEEILWFVNGSENQVTKYPHKLKWPMKKGQYTFQATIPGTSIKCDPVKIEIY